MRTQSGTLAGGHPYTRVGDGSRTLAVLPGVEDAIHPGPHPPGFGWAIGTYFARLRPEYEVYVVSRERELPAEYDIEYSARTHARALEEIRERRAGTDEGEKGRADAVDATDAVDDDAVDADGGDPRDGDANEDAMDVLGISMGGLIGQELARRRPDLVDRLALANSACRLDDDAHEDVRELHRHARNRDWAAIRSDLVEAMFADWRAVSYPPLIRTVWRPFLPRPADPDDVRRSIEAILEFDGTDGLERIDSPTLVFGGEADPYFTPRVARDTAAALPDSDLHLVPGAKHGAFHERKPAFDATLRSFLER